jgi:hypothetical protein
MFKKCRGNHKIQVLAARYSVDCNQQENKLKTSLLQKSECQFSRFGQILGDVEVKNQL